MRGGRGGWKTQCGHMCVPGDSWCVPMAGSRSVLTPGSHCGGSHCGVSHRAGSAGSLTVLALIGSHVADSTLCWLSLALTLLTLHYAGSHYAASAAASLRWRPDSLRSKSHLHSLRVQRKCAMIGVVHLNSKIGEEVCDDWCGASEQLECRGSVL